MPMCHSFGYVKTLRSIVNELDLQLSLVRSLAKIVLFMSMRIHSICTIVLYKITSKSIPVMFDSWPKRQDYLARVLVKKRIFNLFESYFS